MDDFNPKMQFAPPPPVTPVKEAEPEEPEDTEDEEYYGIYDDNIAADFNLSPNVLKTKFVVSTALGIFLLGIFCGSAFFGGSSTSSVRQTGGLNGVVENNDVVAGRRRCGLVEKGQPCVLYLMNSSRYERKGSSFYEEASRLTGVLQYSISMANVQYSETLVPPGYIAKINIPAVK